MSGLFEWGNGRGQSCDHLRGLEWINFSGDADGVMQNNFGDLMMLVDGLPGMFGSRVGVQDTTALSNGRRALVVNLRTGTEWQSHCRINEAGLSRGRCAWDARMRLKSWRRARLETGGKRK